MFCCDQTQLQLIKNIDQAQKQFFVNLVIKLITSMGLEQFIITHINQDSHNINKTVLILAGRFHRFLWIFNAP